MKNSKYVLEALGVTSGLLYTYLLIKGMEICWLFALISASIYLYICFKKRIYAESMLQLFYLFTGVYGWLHWNDSGGEIGSSLPINFHLIIILSGAALVIVNGLLLKKMTDAASPYLDSFTTVFSIFATLLMINLIPENWFYWIVIDTISIILYVKRKLYLTAALFLLYTFMAIEGALSWMPS